MGSFEVLYFCFTNKKKLNTKQSRIYYNWNIVIAKIRFHNIELKGLDFGARKSEIRYFKNKLKLKGGISNHSDG
jgi:hypothetical protein